MKITDSKKILVVDDDEDIVEIVSYILKEKGYQVMALTSGEAVLQTIQLFHPDLVLMDVMLAGMDGRAICTNIKEDKNNVSLPVILISATHDLAKSLTQQGAPNDFLAKPFDVDILLLKVEQQLAA
ncbi:response regulator transcription factor [Mucilaginibacter antarcticus]|uniref:Response regulator transcription factor n=1 Tax=Mucilaginibacter antarcticus TaxID=1855725 RepID=A0ABW5XSR9_9SPHI